MNSLTERLNPSTWPVVILTRHFFRRLFLNETVFFEEQAIQKTIGIIALLSVFPAYIADSLLFIYLLERERGTAWAETALFITLIMLLIGLITLFEWEIIFLDRRDFLNLKPLPVKSLSMFSAKFLSLVLFVGLFAAGINSLSSLVFAMYLSQSRGYGLTGGSTLLLIHLLVMVAAGCFIFFSMAILVGLFKILLRGKFFSGLLDTIRFVLIVAHIFILYFFVLDTKWIQERFENIQALRYSPTPFMMNYPPLWFTGLYQVLNGYRDPFFLKLASRALLSLAVVIGAFFLLTLISYSRYMKKISPEGEKHLRPSILRRIVEPALNFTILRDSVQRASFWFYHSVLRRSRMHRNKVLIYLGLGLGLSLILFASTGRYFWKYQAGNMLSLPLVLIFFLLVGAREASSLPAHQPAGWVFMVTEGSEKWPYFAAFKKFLFLHLILPLHLVLFIFYSILWDWKRAGIHCLYSAVFSVLLMEIILFRQLKLPFACSYLPGKSRIHTRWLIYVAAFSAYILIPRWLEPFFLTRPSGLIGLYLALVLVLAGLRIYHRRYFYPENKILYEDLPEISVVELLHPS